MDVQKLITWVLATIVTLCSILAVAFGAYHHMNNIHEGKGRSNDVLSTTLMVLRNDQAGRLYWLKEKEKTEGLDMVEKGNKQMIEQNLQQIKQMSGVKDD